MPKILSSVHFVPLFILFLFLFMAYQSWQEYKIYQLNQLAYTLHTSAGEMYLRRISWVDYASNEDGYVVERKIEGSYRLLATLEQNAISYLDGTASDDDLLCYRVGAFNQAGTVYSDEFCIDNTDEASGVIDETDEGDVSIVAEFIAPKSQIDIAGREIYTIKSASVINPEFSTAEIENVDFSIATGNLSYRDSNSFVFLEQGEELENGYVSMPFNVENKFSFTLKGNDQEQTAILYLSAGTWGTMGGSLKIRAGESIEILTLPSSHTWHNIKVEFKFKNTTQIEITPTENYSSYSAVQFAAIILNNASRRSEAHLLQVDIEKDSVIDVSTVAFISSTGIINNNSDHPIKGLSVNYEGTTKYRSKGASFMQDGQLVASGQTSMAWQEDNAVNLTLNNISDDVNVASVYFKAGVWSHESASIDLLINGISFPIELAGGFKWFYFKVDIEFEGELDLQLRPIGKFAGYSQLYFTGLIWQ
ncbi:hypothetical protein PCNPT3_01410 [Psychromonas sp. CNPT3]|uniref:hypothetical protein n=1 Tax=Psychromonas sp. CNPT3 TaxID=314282 RepID=UPI00006E9558|nr:hypothetical protein [Psychromonas sp. CNPT3]AGH80224.1 hypothetical protein PCNPT3_01410 [Psychromonas sp. CNPT3]